MRVKAAVQQLQTSFSAERARRHEETDSARHAVRVTVVGAAAVAVLLGLGLAIVVGRSITRPIERLSGMMGGLAAGQLDLEVPDRERRDEVGVMSQAVQVFKDNALAAQVLESEARLARETAERHRTENEAARAAVARQQAEVMELLGHSLTQLSDGDLTERLPSFPEEYRKLEDDFNQAMAKLQDAMSVIAGNGHGIKSGAGEISHAADDLSRRTEQQAASLEETAAALDEITATVRKTAEGATHASALVLAAREEASKSGTIVSDAVAAMTAIERSAAEIDHRHHRRDRLPDQPAGAECRRGGGAGRRRRTWLRGGGKRGPCPGATVRPGREGDQGIDLHLVGAGEFRCQPRGGNRTRAGSYLRQGGGDHDHRVGDRRLRAGTGDGSARGEHGDHQMDQVTQQNAAMVEQSTAASHSLAQEAQQMATLIARFRIGETPAEPEIVRTPQNARRPAARPASRGNLALKQSAQEDSWENSSHPREKRLNVESVFADLEQQYRAGLPSCTMSLPAGSLSASGATAVPRCR